jgi:hypothetical protein
VGRQVFECHRYCFFRLDIADAVTLIRSIVDLAWIKVSKAFFSEEKKQKTFMCLSRLYPEARTQDVKVF